MAGTLLHITLANAALEKAKIPNDIKRELVRADDFRLGAVLVDLPYFEHLFLNGARVLLKREIQFSIWGYRLHMRSPTEFCRALIRGARDMPARAMALGALTHLAIDTLFHGEIERRVCETPDQSRGPNTIHKQIEDQMDLFAHLHLLGHSGTGTAYARETLRLRPDPKWTDRFSEALITIHKTAPPERLLTRWLRGAAMFGALHCYGWLPWVDITPGDDPDLRDMAVALADRAIELSKRYIEIGLAGIEHPIKGEIPISEIPERNLVNGGAAEL